MRRVAVALCCAACAAAAPPAGAATIEPTNIADGFANTGDCTFREAVEAAARNAEVDQCPAGDPAPVLDTVTLDAATYVISIPAGATPDDNDGGDIDIDLAGGPVKVVGAGLANTRIDPNDVDRALDVLGAGSLELASLGIEDGTARGAQPGGAVRAASGDASLALRSVALTANTSEGPGGGLHYLGPGLTVEGSVISNNVVRGSAAGRRGGGVYLGGGGAASITGTTVLGNRVETNGPGAGADVSGGGIATEGAPLTVIRSEVSENSVEVSNGSDLAGGGGVSSHNADAAVFESTVAGNFLGGGASRRGAGLLHVDDAGPANPLSVHNSTISGNDAGAAPSLGGGLKTLGGTSTVSFASFARNVASAGRAVHFEQSPNGGTLTFRASILAEDGSGECAGSGGVGSLGYNVDQGTSCGFSGPGDLSLTDPGLLDLSPNGGPTRTHALPAGSAAVDVVPTSACTDPGGAPLMTDQRERRRPFGPACDPGAFELGRTCLGREATRIGTSAAENLGGTRGTDVILAGGGDDKVNPGLGDDRVCGGGGTDQVSFVDGAGVTATVTGATGQGDDLFTEVESLFGSPFSDRLTGDRGVNVLFGGSGQDLLQGLAANDFLIGAAGRDILFAGAGTDDAFGGAAADRVSGASGRDVLSGGAGFDRLTGGPGRDRLQGQAGRDTLQGGPGADFLNADGGRAELCGGGPGHDRARSCERERSIP